MLANPTKNGILRLLVYIVTELSSHFKSHSLLTTNKNVNNDQPSSSSPHTVIDIIIVTQTILTNLVKEKNVETLQHLGGVHGVVAALNTDVKNGVKGGDDDHDTNDVMRRRDAFGSNTYPKPPARRFFHFVIEGFKDPTVLIFLVYAARSHVYGIKENGIKEGSWYKGGSIFVAVFLVIAVSSISNFRQSRQFDKLSQVSNNIQVDVVRGGRRRQVSICDIVVGDVVWLKIGDQVPANGLFLEGHSLQVDESSMTGEGDHVEINSHENPFLFSGTKVADGLAKMLVTSVGRNTTWGEMMGSIIKSTENINEETPLHGRLNMLTSVMRKVGSAMSFIAVVAIPEGLPSALALTLTLALALALKFPYSSWKKMLADTALVRNLSALETMAFATTICTDKTGTLKHNQMKVTKFWLGQQCIEEKAPETSLHSDVIRLIKEGVALNTTGSVYTYDVSRRKADNKMHAHWKGAAEIVLRLCSNYYDASSNMKDLDNDKKLEFEKIIQDMAASSLRCIAFAHTEVSEVDNGGIKKVKEEGLTLLGIVGIEDPCRRDVKKPVQDFQQAGVSVKMITRDNIFTAKAIATECGILQPNQDTTEAVIEGGVFRNLSPEERLKRVEKICVMARSSPSDKLLMVECLKQKGDVVAVIGNGTKDAPALKEADIGISMGIQGAGVAKESSDIIILDDSNFASVTTVLMGGRCVYNNIQKFIQFHLTVKVAALAINFVAAVSAGEAPLTAVQLLWVDLIVDTFGVLALATEKPTMELLEKPPVGRTEPLVTNIMWRNLLAQASYQIKILLTLKFKGEAIFGVMSSEGNETLIFNTFVLCQVFNVFNARKLEKRNVFEGIHKNKMFMGIIGITIVLQLMMVEFLKEFADTERLNWVEWGFCILMAAMSWPIGWAVKFIPVPRKPLLSFFNTQTH